MNSKQGRVRIWTAAALALAGLVLLIIWAVSLYRYGIWVDANATVGDARPLDYALFALGVVLLGASLLVFLVRRRAHC